jgi:hypothetical protein
MNYVQHMGNFYWHVDKDPRIKALHISLYMALFQTWNNNFFAHSFIMGRTGLMQMSRIGSKTTFARILRDLHDFGYISYDPLEYTTKKPTVTMRRFAEISAPCPGNGTDLVHDMNTPCPEIATAPVPKVGHRDKQIKIIKRENLSLSQNSFKEKKMEPPSLEEVISWFVRNRGTTEVAELFFENYARNGWEMADGPMKNWKSAAIKWIFNAKNTSGNGKSNYLHTDNHKNYGEPL